MLPFVYFWHLPRGRKFSVPFPSIHVGGRLTHFLSQWENITTDWWVLSVIREYFIFSFRGHLHCQRFPSLCLTRQTKRSGFFCRRSSVFDLERSNKEGSGSFQSPGFYSHLFLVPKKTGGRRPVIDLSILNTFLLVSHFKMETNRSIRSCIHPGMWTTSLYLMDAYFHSPIAPPFRKFRRLFGTIQCTNFEHSHSGSQRLPLSSQECFKQ